MTFSACLAVWTTLQSHREQTEEFSKESLKCLTAGLKVEGKYLRNQNVIQPALRVKSFSLAGRINIGREQNNNGKTGYAGYQTVSCKGCAQTSNSHYFAMSNSVFSAIVLRKNC